jgi:hypothetical protein
MDPELVAAEDAGDDVAAGGGAPGLAGEDVGGLELLFEVILVVLQQATLF